MTTVLVFGTFDVLHPGHLYFLKQAKVYGDKLIASVARDDFVEKTKNRKPVYKENERIKHIIEQNLVESAFLSDEISGSFLIIKKINPDIICLGYDQERLKGILKSWLKAGNMNIKIITIASYKAEKYKSSKIVYHSLKENIKFALKDTVFMALDLETTGLDSGKNKIIEIGAILFNTERILDKYQCLIDPGVSIPENITAINGITNGMVKGQKTIEEVLPDFLEFSKGVFTIAHNAYFDIGFIIYDLSRLGIIPDDTSFVFDTLSLTRQLFKNFNRYSLSALAKEFNISSRGFHRALSDAVACQKIFFKCLEEIEKVNKGINPDILLKYKEKDLSLSWPDILKNKKLDLITNAIINKTKIRITAPRGNFIHEMEIQPKAITINKQKLFLEAVKENNLIYLLMDKIKIK